MNNYNIKLHLQINKAKFIEKENPLFNEELLLTAIVMISEAYGYDIDLKDLIIENNHLEYSGLINLINFDTKDNNEAGPTLVSLIKTKFIHDFETWCKDIIEYYKDGYKLSVKAYKMTEGTSQIIYNNFSVKDWLYFRNAVLGLPDIFNINFELLNEKDFYFEKCGIQYILEVI